MRNYSTTAMSDLSETDYETLLLHLGEQLTACIHRAPDGEAAKSASDALANEWRGTLTANDWLHAAGARLGVDTSGCVGA
jgi:hypothetical protein